MNYTELCAAVVSTTAQTFAPEDLARFCEQTEQKVYNSVQIAELRKNMLGSLSTGNPYLSAPPDFLYPYSLAVKLPDGSYEYLLNKDVNYVRAAYPDPAATGVPKCYALFDADTMLLGPSPSSNYVVEMHYGYYPVSIVTAGTSWLGDNFDSVLLNGMLCEAARFMKEEADIVALYDKMFVDSVALLKQLGDAKQRQDAYRSGQVRLPVR